MDKAKYTEPSDFFPKEIRKEFGLGEFAKPEKTEKKKKDDMNKQFREYVNNKD